MDDDLEDRWTLAVEHCRLKTIDALEKAYRVLNWDLIKLGETSDEIFTLIPCAIDEDRSKRIDQIARVLKHVITKRMRSGRFENKPLERSEVTDAVAELSQDRIFIWYGRGPRPASSSSQSGSASPQEENQNQPDSSMKSKPQDNPEVKDDGALSLQTVATGQDTSIESVQPSNDSLPKDPDQ